jgi:hypothetical protein
MNNKLIIKPKFISQKSFYNKCYIKIKQYNNKAFINIYSYKTLVAIIVIDFRFYPNIVARPITIYLDNSKRNKSYFYSATTLKHIKEALKQVLEPFKSNRLYRITIANKQYNLSILNDITKNKLFEISHNYKFKMKWSDVL